MKKNLFSYEVRFDLPKKENRLREISELSTSADFWNDNRKAQALLKEKSKLETDLGLFTRYFKQYEDTLALFDLSQELNDEASLQEVVATLEPLQMHVDDLELQKMLSKEADGMNAIVSINAGAGGTESQDWASMLFRMYSRWAQASSYKVEVVDILEGEQAGLKSVTFIVSGVNAFGFLKAEIGIHRLVRISPFDSNARRHTSFASLFVTPEVDDEIEVEIRDVDLRVDTYRSGGKGGQGVNTTDSAVRLTHFPTGIVVQCQNERSQIKNKALAMKILRSRIYEKKLEEEKKKLAEIEDTKKDIAWGSQIRSYVLHPYKMVKDHRTGFTSSQAEKTLDGDLDGFIKAYLKCALTGSWAKGGADLDV